MTAEEVLHFWFDELGEQGWWSKSADTDRLIEKRFAKHLEAAKRCELFAWRSSAQGRLAEIVVLDQFSRNIFRDSARAFEADSQALALAQEAVRLGSDRQLNPQQRTFLYMPYMHSESRIIHTTALDLFRENGLQSNLDFEIRHKEIIDRFGRYPHRNSLLGRESTPEELEFLEEPGSSF